MKLMPSSAIRKNSAGLNMQHDRLEDRDHDGEDDRADDAADAGGGDAGAERPRRLALLGQRIAVERRRGIVAVAGNAEHDAGDLAAGAVDRVHGEQEDGAGDHVHAVDEGNRHRDRQLAADAGRHADQQPEDHGDQHQTHDVGRAQQGEERGEHDVDHRFFTCTSRTRRRRRPTASVSVRAGRP